VRYNAQQMALLPTIFLNILLAFTQKFTKQLNSVTILNDCGAIFVFQGKVQKSGDTEFNQSNCSFCIDSYRYSAAANYRVNTN